MWIRGLEESGIRTKGNFEQVPAPNCLSEIQKTKFLENTCIFPLIARLFGPSYEQHQTQAEFGFSANLDQPLWFPSAQKKMKDPGKHVAPLWHVASLYSVFCDGLLNNLTTFWWGPGKLAYDKFYREKREIATKKNCGVKLVHTSKKLVLIFLKVHTKFQIICYLKSYAGVIFSDSK